MSVCRYSEGSGRTAPEEFLINDYRYAAAAGQWQYQLKTLNGALHEPDNWFAQSKLKLIL